MKTGLDIASFLEEISAYNSTTYFHNLKFDGHFVIDALLKMGFVHVLGRELGKEQFSSLISDMNRFYSITIKWANGCTTELRDSQKKFANMSVKRVAESFKMEQGKGEMDYHAPRPPGHVPTEAELDYLYLDVKIVADALKLVIDNGMTKLTTASDSMAEYKRLMGKTLFNRYFPVLSDEMDAEIRQAYRGGFTYADERFKSKRVGAGIVLDVNSLYPAVMYNSVLPYGFPVYSEGMPVTTKERPLSIFGITFIAKLKPDHIPCIQIKGSSIFGGTEYLKEINEPTTLMMTNIDLALYQDHYDMTILSVHGGWLFNATRGMFDTYIDKWSEIKMNSEGGQREIAKLHLNSLYGKFASNPNVTGKIPYLEDDLVKYKRGPDETRPPIYTAVGVFITSYARDLTIRAAQASYPVFAYADTDSLHLLTDTPPTALEVHPTKMGAWKFEYAFTEAHFVRSKAYLQMKADGTYKTAWAGLPEQTSSKLTFASLVDGVILHGKLGPRSVPGGIVLEDVPYTLKL